jgi:hypothetical protein
VAAEAVALAALNAQRAERYARTSGIPVDDSSWTEVPAVSGSVVVGRPGGEPFTTQDVS